MYYIDAGYIYATVTPSRIRVSRSNRASAHSPCTPSSTPQFHHTPARTAVYTPTTARLLALVLGNTFQAHSSIIQVKYCAAGFHPVRHNRKGIVHAVHE